MCNLHKTYCRLCKNEVISKPENGFGKQKGISRMLSEQKYMEAKGMLRRLMKEFMDPKNGYLDA